MTDHDYLAQAVALADHCPPSDSAFSVGCVIVDPQGVIVATGFSRERGPTWHAEEAAITKAREQGLSLDGATLYASLEPCGERKSGALPCVDHILNEGITRVVYAAEEPSLFVEGVGRERLQLRGVEIDHISGFEARFKQQNAHLFK